MMRQAALQCLRSAQKTSKSKPFCVANINTTIYVSKLKYGLFRKLWPQSTHQLRSHHFCSISSLKDFTVTRSEPELVGPTEPTPFEIKPLSTLDHRECTRGITPVVQFFRYNPSMKGKDPARVIRDALARALVLYYPLAGRVIQSPDGKLSVECTGEGVSFVEAEADIELAQFGDPPRPPFLWFNELVSNIHIDIHRGVYNSPLIYIQVTRLKCGGFIVALRYNHVVCDAPGFDQFLTAVGQIARGARAPSPTPIWSRELFTSPHPQPHQHGDLRQPATMTPCSFFFGHSDLSAIQNLLPAHVRPHATKFEALTAHLWRCRVKSFQLDRDDVASLACLVNARGRAERVVPDGYYGNAFAAPVVEARVGELCDRPIEYAIGLVKRAKEEGVRECESWRAGPPELKGINVDNLLMVSDLRRFGLGRVDYGWGGAVYSGVARIEAEQGTVYLPVKSDEGEDGILATMCLRNEAMGRFEIEVKNTYG